MSVELVPANWSAGTVAARRASANGWTGGPLDVDRGVLRLDAQLRVLDACVTARRIVGRRLEELVGTRLLDLVEDGAANLEALCRQLVAGDIRVGVLEVRPLAHHVALPRSELTVSWLPHHDVNRAVSSPTGSFVIVITPVERDHGAPADPATTGEIVERVPDLILRYRLWPERGFDYVGPSCHALLGYPAAAFYAQPDLFLDLAVDRAEMSAMFERWEGSAPSAANPVIRLRHRDGRVRAFELRTTSIRNPERQILAVEAVGREVTDRDEADRELRAIVAFRRNMHEVAGDDLDEAEPSDVLRAALAAVCDHTGWELGHVLVAGSEPGFLVSADVWHLSDAKRFEPLRQLTAGQQWAADTDLVGDAFMLAITTVAEVVESQTNERGRQARRCGLRMAVAVPVPMGDGVGAILEFFSDAPTPPGPGLIRALEDAAAEVGRAMKRTNNVLTMRRLDEARSAFVARASHELRGPVGSVALMASALARQARQSSSADLASSLSRLAERAERIQAMATRLLELSQLERGGLEVNLEAVAVADAVEAAVAAMLPALGPPVVVDVIEPDLRVVADPLLLEEMLANLLANARRYGGPNISVEVHAVDDRVVVAVCDDGPGVAPELVEHLFEPMRAALATPDHAGLGLALVRQMARSLGGEATYEPAGDSSARFVVTLVRS